MRPPSSSIRENIRALPPAAWTLFAGTFINRFGGFVLPFLVLYLTRRGMSAAEAGGIASLYGVGSVAALAAGGPLADHVGRREAIAVSTFSSAATMVALSQAATLPGILVLTALAGFTTELYRPASAALVADLTPLGQRVTAFALYRLAVNAGFALGPATAGLLARRSYLLLFLGDASTSVVFGVIALVAFPVGVRARGGPGSASRALPAILADGAFLRLLAATLALAVVEQQSISTFALYVRDTGHSGAVYGALMSVNGGLIIVCELALTAVTRRFAPRWVLASGVILSGGGFALTALAHGVVSLTATVVIWTVGEMLFAPVAAAYVADLAPVPMRGRYQAAFGLCFSLGLVLAPTVGGAVYERSAGLLWAGCGVLGVVSAALILTIPERARDGVVRQL